MGTAKDVPADLIGLRFEELSPGEALEVTWVRTGKG
jgi:hypothetical protein